MKKFIALSLVLTTIFSFGALADHNDKHTKMQQHEKCMAEIQEICPKKEDKSCSKEHRECVDVNMNKLSKECQKHIKKMKNKRAKNHK